MIIELNTATLFVLARPAENFALVQLSYDLPLPKLHLRQQAVEVECRVTGGSTEPVVEITSKRTKIVRDDGMYRYAVVDEKNIIK